MNLLNKPPFGQKKPNEGKNPAYLQAVRKLPCCICEAFGEQQLSATTAHHVIMGRFSARKTPDRMAVPLCEGHHQGLLDTSKTAIHREPAAWREKYGADHEWTAATQDKIEGSSEHQANGRDI